MGDSLRLPVKSCPIVWKGIRGEREDCEFGCRGKVQTGTAAERGRRGEVKDQKENVENEERRSPVAARVRDTGRRLGFPGGGKWGSKSWEFGLV